MKKIIFFTLALAQMIVFYSCNKEQGNPNQFYDNSQSYVKWTIAPIAGGDGPDQLIAGWNFDSVYTEPRLRLTSAIGPYYGYPVGALDPQGRLSYDYGNDCGMDGQQMAVFFFTDTALKREISLYSLAPTLTDNYVARISAKNTYRNLYMNVAGSSLIINEYNDKFCIGQMAAGSCAVVKGIFRIAASNSAFGEPSYLIKGSFQFPVPIH